MRYLDPHYAVAPQITPADVAALQRQGFATLICNRPDGEGAGQPLFAEIAAAAGALGIEAHYLPVTPAQITQADRDAFAALYAAAPKPVLGFCRTGNRAEQLWHGLREGAGGA
ncbi:TIGR01244 family sulfur transferase [Massilia sp.]|uniref:TIGR01244 family sulfur transferase n=1 Tax=Massilia sp. TaxID=1882437 RepID=UPI0028ACAED6|nr:TIGR01244 family sulfur transferase [Massilia sp.]